MKIRRGGTPDRGRSDPRSRAAGVPLHRRVYLIGSLVAALTLVVAGVGLFELHSEASQSTSLVARNAARGLLNKAQLDIGQSQIQLELAMSGGRTASTLAALPSALAQEQKGIDEWARYEAIARQWGPLPAGSTQLQNELRKLQTASGPPSSSQSPGTALSGASLAEMAAIGQQVDVDFSEIRSHDQGWWTTSLSNDEAATTRGLEWLLLVAVLAILGSVLANALLARIARRRDVELAERDHDLERAARTNEFEARLQRALELSSTEDRVFEVVEQALSETVPELSVEMLLADSSQAHFQRLVSTGSEPTHRCSVESPIECPAAQRGEVLIFESSLALDACPYLARQLDPCSAVCVPVSVSGMTVGVVHAAGLHQEPPEADRRVALELVARRSSDRIGLMRAFSRSEIQASTDPLTGLSNRRSFENEVRQLSSAGTPYALAFGDLDHFKQINDVHGHGTGDQALRLFAQVLREGLRDCDLCARYGGEEFVVALPNCEELQAVQVLERIRERLALNLIEAGLPSFTVSFGLARSQTVQRLDGMVSTADAALLQAKSLGRNRVVVAGTTVLADNTNVADAPVLSVPRAD
jgi:diguanylate cyclase (GGDEF)-like protein